MATIRDHYASHLAPIYLWMAGGFDNAMALGESDLSALGIEARTGMAVLDLGAGFGMHTIPLARAGCAITALDSSAILLNELRAHADGLPIRVIEGDLLNAASYVTEAPQLVLCMGDTVTHLQTEQEVEDLFTQVARIMAPGGLFVVTFRDYTSAACGDSRFIAVRSDANRIHTCFLEAQTSHMVVHDIVHERSDAAWRMKVSSYRKLRLSPQWASAALRRVGLEPAVAAGPRGMVQITARCPAR